MIIFYSGSGSGKRNQSGVGICEPEVVLRERASLMLSYSLIVLNYGDQKNRMLNLSKVKRKVSHR